MESSFYKVLLRKSHKWGGKQYLASNLTFTNNRKEAAKLRILKLDDTQITNSDKISLSFDDKYLVSDDTLSFKEKGCTFFVVSNGTDDRSPLSYESPLYFSTEKGALRYRRKSEEEPFTYILAEEKIDNLGKIKDFEFYLEKDVGSILYNPPRKGNYLSLKKQPDYQKQCMIVAYLLMVLFTLYFLTKSNYSW